MLEASGVDNGSSQCVLGAHNSEVDVIELEEGHSARTTSPWQQGASEIEAKVACSFPSPFARLSDQSPEILKPNPCQAPMEYKSPSTSGRCLRQHGRPTVGLGAFLTS